MESFLELFISPPPPPQNPTNYMYTILQNATSSHAYTVPGESHKLHVHHSAKCHFLPCLYCTRRTPQTTCTPFCKMPLPSMPILYQENSTNYVYTILQNATSSHAYTVPGELHTLHVHHSAKCHFLPCLYCTRRTPQTMCTPFCKMPLPPMPILYQENSTHYMYTILQNATSSHAYTVPGELHKLCVHHSAKCHFLPCLYCTRRTPHTTCTLFCKMPLPPMPILYQENSTHYMYTILQNATSSHAYTVPGELHTLHVHHSAKCHFLPCLYCTRSL